MAISTFSVCCATELNKNGPRSIERFMVKTVISSIRVPLDRRRMSLARRHKQSSTFVVQDPVIHLESLLTQIGDIAGGSFLMEVKKTMI